MRRPRGVTLLELLAVMSIGLILVLTIGQVDLARTRMMHHFDRRPLQEGLVSEAGLSWLEIARQLERADRVVLSNRVTPSCESGGSSAFSSECYRTARLRIPHGTAFGEAGNYRWFQYRFAMDGSHGRITAYEDSGSDCAPDIVFKDIAEMHLQFQHVAKAPPGPRDPFDGPEDNNIVNLLVSSTAEDVTFSGPILMRAAAYTDVEADCGGDGCDSGLGLAPPGVDAPPPQCG